MPIRLFILFFRFILTCVRVLRTTEKEKYLDLKTASTTSFSTSFTTLTSTSSEINMTHSRDENDIGKYAFICTCAIDVCCCLDNDINSNYYCEINYFNCNFCKNNDVNDNGNHFDSDNSNNIYNDNDDNNYKIITTINNHNPTAPSTVVSLPERRQECKYSSCVTQLMDILLSILENIR